VKSRRWPRAAGYALVREHAAGKAWSVPSTLRCQNVEGRETASLVFEALVGAAERLRRRPLGRIGAARLALGRGAERACSATQPPGTPESASQRAPRERGSERPERKRPTSASKTMARTAVPALITALTNGVDQLLNQLQSGDGVGRLFKRVLDHLVHRAYGRDVPRAGRAPGLADDGRLSTLPTVFCATYCRRPRDLLHDAARRIVDQPLHDVAGRRRGGAQQQTSHAGNDVAHETTTAPPAVCSVEPSCLMISGWLSTKVSVLSTM